LRVLPADGWPFPALLEALLPILPDGLQHHKPRFLSYAFCPSQQALVNQRRYSFDDTELLDFVCMSHCLRCIESEATLEDRKATEESLLHFIQQIVAPGNRPTKGLLAEWQVPCPADQQRQPLL